MSSYIENPKGHVWKTRDGEVDIVRLYAGYHNGPICVNCGYYFCHHCESGPQYECKHPGGDES